MKRATLATLMAALAVAGAAPAEAKRICGVKVHTVHDETRAYFGSFLAVCLPSGACRTVTYVKDDQAPLQWSHRLALHKPERTGPWSVELTAVLAEMEVSEGFDLTVDGREPIRVPPEAISTPGAINDYRLNAGLTGPLMESFGPGANVEWRYAGKADKQPRAVWFALRGLKRSMRWAECMQRR